MSHRGQVYPSYSFLAYLWDLELGGWFSFVLLHQDVGPTSVSWSDVYPQLRLALELAAVYWICDAVAGNFEMDFSLTRGQNLGLHARGVRILSMSMVGGALAIMAVDWTGLASPSPWRFCGSLMALKLFYDIARGKKGRVESALLRH